MAPKFCVITTTYRRPDTVLRAVSSVTKQTYPGWEHIVVVDDPISDYSKLYELETTSPQLNIIKNGKNLGKNASVNLALEYLSTKSFDGYVVFLDDDDWLTPNCLADFADMINKSGYSWLVSERINNNDKKPYTVNKTGKDIISYQYNCLLKKDFYGDTTHCIHFPSSKSIRFPLLVKNAEEWLYFAHLSTIHPKFFFLQKAGTLSEGYTSSGLTDLYHQNQERNQNTLRLMKELWQRRVFSLFILTYITLRLIRSIL